MTTPLDTCPACGSPEIPKGANDRIYFECGAAYRFIQTGDWERVDKPGYQCRNAFAIAVSRVAEIERLKAQLALCRKAFDELDAQKNWTRR